MTVSAFLRGVCVVAVAMLLTVPAIAAGAVGASGQVKVGAAVSGSALTVNVSALPRARCALRLGTGSEAVSLPDLRVAPNGRGHIRTDLSSDAPTGDQPVVAACGHAGSSSIGKTTVSISAIGLHGPVATSFNIALDALLIGGLLIFALLLGEMAIGSDDTRERFLRCMALVGGAILALGARVSGIDFTNSIVNSLVGSDPAGTEGKLLIAVLTALVAAAFGWYFTQVVLVRANRGVRLACALGALTIVGLALLLAEAISVQGLFLEAAAISNFAFMVGLIGGVIFSVPSAEASQGGRGVLTNLVGKLAKSRAGDEEKARPSQRRSPFAGD